MVRIKEHFYRIFVPSLSGKGRFRLAVLADLHNNRTLNLPELLDKIKPDYILVAGDMTNRPTRRKAPSYQRSLLFFKETAGKYPVYYAMGNHESTWAADPRYQSGFEDYLKQLEGAGVVFLRNESLFLDAEKNIRLSGLELGKEQYTHHFGKKQRPTPAELNQMLGEAAGFEILIAHNPDYWKEYAAWGADLVLSGHIHGGQVRLPFIGGLVAPGLRLFPRYSKGLYEQGQKKMIVSAGLGTHTMPFRVANPRELVIIELTGERE